MVEDGGTGGGIVNARGLRGSRLYSRSILGCIILRVLQGEKCDSGL